MLAVLKRVLSRLIDSTSSQVPQVPQPNLAGQLPSLSSKEMQVMLMLQYRQMLHAGGPLPSFDEVGFRVCSDADEDGIIHYIFSLIGTTNKKLVDIGARVIDGSNTANLLINHGWTGLLIDGDPANTDILKRFYTNSRDTHNYPPLILNTWVSAENINSIMAENNMTGELDLLCIDIDGVDYWILKALENCSPRVIVVEYQCIWGPEKAMTVPYDPAFKGGFEGKYGVYSGASLAAFVKLLKNKDKGYRLVGCHRYGYNAFFIRNDIANEILPEIQPIDCYKHPFTQWAVETLLPKVKNRKWVEV